MVGMMGDKFEKMWWLLSGVNNINSGYSGFGSHGGYAEIEL